MTFVAFTGAGLVVYMKAAGGHVGGIVVMLFFGACSLIAGLQLVFPPVLVLTADGYTTRSFGRSVTRSWADVESFIPVRAGGGMVGIRLDRVITARSALRALVSDIAGYDGGALPDTYGMKASELANLMNEWRARAVAG